MSEKYYTATKGFYSTDEFNGESEMYTCANCGSNDVTVNQHCETEDVYQCVGDGQEELVPVVTEIVFDYQCNNCENSDYDVM